MVFLTLEIGTTLILWFNIYKFFYITNSSIVLHIVMIILISRF